MSTVYFAAIIGGDRERGYSVFFPDLPGMTSAGDTLQHAAEQAREGLQSHIELMIEDGEAIPTPRALDDIAYDPEVTEAARVLIPVAIPSTRFLRVNVSLPEDLVHRIDAKVANRSRFLAEAAEKALSE